jgi:tripeptide aminopeptidase
MPDTLLNRFLRYVAIDTRADPTAAGTPSSPGQGELARLLADELRALGLNDATADAHAYVTASLPGSAHLAGAPAIGLLAHLDTAPEAPGAHVRPRVIPGYDGSEIELRPGMRFGPERFPMLREQQGKTLIVTGGDTLLGADDKAGIAIIMTVLERLLSRPDAARAPLRIAFVPDEEIGHGARLLDLEAFGAAWAFTLDGSGLGTLQYENFNAAGATVDIRGLSIHPGQALDRMVNAVLIGQDFLNRLPRDEIPAKPTDYQGFYHVTDFTSFPAL